MCFETYICRGQIAFVSNRRKKNDRQVAGTALRDKYASARNWSKITGRKSNLRVHLMGQGGVVSVQFHYCIYARDESRANFKRRTSILASQTFTQGFCINPPPSACNWLPEREKRETFVSTAYGKHIISFRDPFVRVIRKKKGSRAL